MMSSKYAFARTQVIVLRHDRLAIPLAIVGNEGVPLALAFTELDDARARMTSDVPATPKSLPMHQLVRMIPQDWGVIVDIDRPHPQVVGPGDRDQVINDSGLFPAGAPVTLAPPSRRERDLCGALQERTKGAAGIARVWLLRHQVDVLPAEVLVVVAADDEASGLRYSDAVYEVAHAINHPDPVSTAWIDEIPVEHAMWVRQQPALIEPVSP
ncbi:hypothetical protein JYQ29_02705 [Curtobacterium flaccumfaciens pv. flaccumfaciens]|nr:MULTISPECIES: hypothetical protein [Curtobacterium]MBO9055889.1 hypothetical protein [Curtobacterium flaccumfaciens pv. flaccumfaciens]QVG65811.1 hypothetical protein JG551_003271 [Curtobacterium flaccumfaciens pv. flaccumfaciens]